MNAMLKANWIFINAGALSAAEAYALALQMNLCASIH